MSLKEAYKIHLILSVQMFVQDVLLLLLLFFIYLFFSKENSNPGTLCAMAGSITQCF